MPDGQLETAHDTVTGGDGCGVDLDAYFVGLRGRLFYLLQLKNLRRSVGCADDWLSWVSS